MTPKKVKEKRNCDNFNNANEAKAAWHNFTIAGIVHSAFEDWLFEKETVESKPKRSKKKSCPFLCEDCLNPCKDWHLKKQVLGTLATEQQIKDGVIVDCVFCENDKCDWKGKDNRVAFCFNFMRGGKPLLGRNATWKEISDGVADNCIDCHANCCFSESDRTVVCKCFKP